MKGNDRRPPWSQPLCDDCYIRRFGSECGVRSPYQPNEHCFDCGAVTDTGIYIDSRESQSRYDVDAWIREHGEYRHGVAPGSAERTDAAPPRSTEEGK